SIECILERFRPPDSRLEVEGPHEKLPRRPIRLQVGTADEPISIQERQHVVAVDALVLAFVDLDHMAEAEDPLEERAIPEHVVERREQYGAGGHAAVEIGIGGNYHGGATIVDRDAPYQSVRDEPVDVRLDPASSAVETAMLR